MAKPDTFKTMQQYVFHFGSGDELTIVLEPHHKIAAEDGRGWIFEQDGRKTIVYSNHVMWAESSEFQLKVREE